ncbi:hypothetical protein D3C76_1421900 [compost metagenome]
MQVLLQCIQLLGVVHFQGFDLYPGNSAQLAGVLRIAHGSDDVPAIFVQALHQTQAQATRGADDQGCLVCRHFDTPSKKGAC